jgi:hypothetical protein
MGYHHHRYRPIAFHTAFIGWAHESGDLPACCLTIVSGSTSSFIASGYPGMKADLHASDEENALTLSVYALGSVSSNWFRQQLIRFPRFGIAPLVLASFSEEYGRRPCVSIGY